MVVYTLRLKKTLLAFLHLHINYRPGPTVYVYMGAKFKWFYHYLEEAKHSVSPAIILGFLFSL